MDTWISTSFLNYMAGKSRKSESLEGWSLSKHDEKEEDAEEIAALELTPKEIKRAEKISKARKIRTERSARKSSKSHKQPSLVAIRARISCQVPKDKDLNAAFTQADTDKSGRSIEEFMVVPR